jgi:hypothetical protein
MPVPEDEQIRAALSRKGGANALTTLIYRDPLSWLEPLAAVARSANGALRTEAFVALATALLPAAVRSSDRIPLDQVLTALRSGLRDDSPALSALACAEALGLRAGVTRSGAPRASSASRSKHPLHGGPCAGVDRAVVRC